MVMVFIFGSKHFLNVRISYTSESLMMGNEEFAGIGLLSDKRSDSCFSFKLIKT